MTKIKDQNNLTEKELPFTRDDVIERARYFGYTEKNINELLKLYDEAVSLGMPLKYDDIGLFLINQKY